MRALIVPMLVAIAFAACSSQDAATSPSTADADASAPADDGSPGPDGSTSVDDDASPQVDSGVSDANDVDADAAVDSGSDAGGCASQTVCVPAAPVGWTGPVSLVTAVGAATPSCTSAYPTKIDAAYSQLAFSPAQCTCAPDTPGLSACWGSASISVGISTGCGGYQGSIYTDATCRQATFPGFYALGGDAAVISAQSKLVCTGKVSSSVLPAPSWGSASALCAPPTPTQTCAGGSCLPDGGDPVCVSKAGAQTCPAAFPNAHTLYRSFTDSRYCGCSTAYVGGGCDGSLDFYQFSGCTGMTASVSLPVSSCTDVGTFFKVAVAAKFNATAVTATCPQPTASANGTVAGADTVTVCCL